ncbi:hypothetical protein MXB_3800 [Myxobolus squamalis]|nr:hypothetical protein MXB_3800 [Myxobolus squamalis]
MTHNTIYKCANYQLEKCFARLIIKQIEIIQSGNHSCKINCNIEDKNIEYEIEKYVSTASKDLSKYPNQIYEELKSWSRIIDGKYERVVIFVLARKFGYFANGCRNFITAIFCVTPRPFI